MKKQIYTFIGLIIALTIFSATAVQAQLRTTAKARIPFEFSVKNRTVAAGDYLINRQDDGGEVWSLRGGANRQSVMLMISGVEPRKTYDSGKMTFHRYGNKYFLVGMEMDAYKIDLPKSRAERDAEQDLKQNIRLSKNEKASETVSIEITM